ncbi:MAG: Alcohol dehydrogenase GroES domain protein [Clostridiaceae bacterium]|jgi:L-iditol 2-dehydrogenase|nr:Alcohol dehydrogenase GroES domain protein [Clostridiaceae bacterium]
MQALAKLETGYNNMKLIDIENPNYTDDQVKIKVKYTGICGSDIHTYKGEYKNPTVPVVLGHEFSGEVVGVGKNVTGIKLGDYVTSETTYYVCEKCEYCKTKDYNLCPSRKGLGTQANGSFAEYVVARGKSVHVLPEGVDLLSAALTEPLACTVHAAMEKVKINENEKVLVFGPGPIGLMTAQVAKANGAFVMIAGIEKDAKRLELAEKIGIDKTVNIQKEDLEEVVNGLTNGYGVNKVFECSGSIQAMNNGLNLLRKKGTLVQIGLFAKSLNELNEEKVIQKEITYIGSRSQKPSSWDIALNLMAENKVDMKSLVSDIFKLKDWDKAFDKVMKGEGIKVVIES